jgi:hypothetical protein
MINMDIADISPTERTIEILHPRTKEPVGIRVVLVSLEDDKLSKLKRKIQDRKNGLEARGKHFKAEEVEENKNELLFSSMVGWEWYDATYKGEKPAFTRAKVYELLNDPARVWFRDQLLIELGDTEAFFAS